MYREDYAWGGIRMLPVIEPDGESTARRIVGCSVLLIPISLVPRLLGMTGSIYATTAVATGLGLLYFGVRRFHLKFSHTTSANKRDIATAGLKISVSFLVSCGLLPDDEYSLV